MSAHRLPEPITHGPVPPRVLPRPEPCGVSWLPDVARGFVCMLVALAGLAGLVHAWRRGAT